MLSLLRILAFVICISQLIACSTGRYIAKQAKEIVLSDSNLRTAHVGISIYDAGSNKYLYNHQGDHYFIPASNTKLFACYAGMKYLKDSLPGLRYYFAQDSSLMAFATGDPSLLHPDFKTHRVHQFLQSINKPIHLSLNWKAQALGNGWAWNDYDEAYAAERSALPVYGNLITIKGNAEKWTFYPATPSFKVLNDYAYSGATRDVDSNVFHVRMKSGAVQQFEIPYKTNNGQLNVEVLSALLSKSIVSTSLLAPKQLNTIYSQPTDSLLKPMMHRSDNFFAEQTLLMVSNEMTGVMNDAKIIDSLLRTDLADLPQRPRWVDGSGLSRYNLFTPQDFVTVLRKMKSEFSWDRITTILPTGGDGTLSNYYINLKNRIFAKTGTLSNNVALSGFLITKDNRTLIFSVIVNNHMGNTTQIRRAVEKYLKLIADRY